MIAVCWQTWTDIREVTAVILNGGCLDVGLRKQHLVYHISWDCWYFKLLVWFCVLHCVMLAVLTDGR